MKKTKAKLQLKASTVRFLNHAALARAAGGEPPSSGTEWRELCSFSCDACPTDASWCCETTS